jgi:hypothetical protein
MRKDMIIMNSGRDVERMHHDLVRSIILASDYWVLGKPRYSSVRTAELLS